jgi:hypothetical protein
MSFAVFVNTSDGFEDCWAPFFSLFERYGGILRQAPVYLNTERKSFSWPGLNLSCTRVWPEAHAEQRLSWGECLARGLGAVKEPYVLYLQEDYFLDRPVRDDMVTRALDRIANDEEVGVVYLNEHGPRYRRSRPSGDGFVEIVGAAQYLVNTQAATWRKDFLLAQVRSWENAWTFEKFASLRARGKQRQFLTVSPAVMAEAAVIDHVHTGIARGKWQVECVPLFAREAIDCDFSKRGFYRSGSRTKYRVEVLARLFESPGNALRSVWSLM